MIETIVVLVLFVKNPPLAAVNGEEPRGAHELATYASRTECDIAARTVRIDAKAARLRCVVRELSPDERQAIAIRVPAVLP
ncbi:MAG: hypothetical protein IKE60_34445 [Reyranella sp.]|uniref:hypothetical protein n=1 Tax=Reyranella sp. TaxID=1929291 RepID=UPI0025F80371|nr:hypothetical protein [Reyranella sp.]MBR2819821.1 hypothetical protein [Reyranella sp.]